MCMHVHFSATKWCNVGNWNGALWDLFYKFIDRVIMRLHCVMNLCPITWCENTKPIIITHNPLKCRIADYANRTRYHNVHLPTWPQLASVITLRTSHAREATKRSGWEICSMQGQERPGRFTASVDVTSNRIARSYISKFMQTVRMGFYMVWNLMCTFIASQVIAHLKAYPREDVGVV